MNGDVVAIWIAPHAIFVGVLLFANVVRRVIGGF